MAKRTTKKLVAGITQDQYEDSLSKFAAAQAKSAKLNAEMDVKMTKIRDSYAAELNQLTEEQKKNFDIVKTYCVENKEELFTDKRSMDNSFGRVGFRLGTPALKTLKDFTWDMVILKLEGVLPDYVRTEKEVNKEALIADRANEKVAPLLASVGVYVAQGESFFIELKKEEPAAV